VIGGFTRLLLFQGLGEVLSKFLLPFVPGPVLGLLLLLGWLSLRGKVQQDLEAVSAAFSRHLGLLFVPAAVGVVMFLPQLREHAFAIGAALVASVLATVGASALLLRLLAPAADRHEP
jgi:holin-like protein